MREFPEDADEALKSVNRMPLEPFNPYAPPQATDPRPASGGRRRIWVEVFVRALAVVLGFSLVADPTSMPGVHSFLVLAVGGLVFARGVGLISLVLAFVPWRIPRRAVTDDAEDDRSEGKVEEL